jgi:hypothetical protein
VELKHKCRPRSLSFNDRLKVVLIPSRKDYQSCGLLDVMWWQPEDYVYFKDDAKAEVFEVMRSKRLDSSAAIRCLYHEVTNQDQGCSSSLIPSSEDTNSFASADCCSSDDGSRTCSPCVNGTDIGWEEESHLPEFLELYAQSHKHSHRVRSDSLSAL